MRQVTEKHPCILARLQVATLRTIRMEKKTKPSPVKLDGVESAGVLHSLLKRVQAGVQVLVDLLQILAALPQALCCRPVDGLDLHLVVDIVL